MTQQDAELLLKDLGARLAYHPVIYGKEGVSANEGILTSVTTSGVRINTKGGCIHYYFIEEIKPYLRPMSSMTEEEKAEYFTLKHRDKDRTDNIILISEASALIDWLNKKHFDWRTDGNCKTMIEKGLAIEAPKGMYEIN